MEVRSIETIVRALNGAGVQYLIVGGLAVSAHGYERLTVDVDLVVGLEPENITRAQGKRHDCAQAVERRASPDAD